MDCAFRLMTVADDNAHRQNEKVAIPTFFFPHYDCNCRYDLYAELENSHFTLSANPMFTYGAGAGMDDQTLSPSPAA
jgi:hypothetical protein